VGGAVANGSVPHTEGDHVPRASNRVKVFDGVRGLAILGVIVFHTMPLDAGYRRVDRAIGHATSAGWMGVDLFFVLSGFLITGILLDIKGTPKFFKNFYGRRALRILPLFYGTLLVATVLLPLAYALGPWHNALGKYTHDLVHNQAWVWLYAQNFKQATEPHTLPGLGHLWSLAIEEQFYLVWPLVVFLVPAKRLLRVAVLASLAVALLRIGLAAGGSEPWAIRQWTFTRVDTLMLGAVAAIIVRNPALRAKVRPFVRPVLMAGVLFLVVAAIVKGPLRQESVFMVDAIYPAGAITFAALMVALCDSGNRFLENRWLRMVGFYSYAMYVFHWPIAQAYIALWKRLGVTAAITRHGTGTLIPWSLLQFTAVALSTLLAAMISWRFWESRWLRLKERFRYVATEPEPAVTPPLATPQ
jgi:peptidoglycan/LPS O-acetylase OafA/YrhL